MARNAEKAMTTLARWRAAQVQEAGGQRERRPYLASECNDLPQAERWRLQIVREIAKKVAQIQNEMDKEQNRLPQVSPALSIREPSLQSQNILKLPESLAVPKEELAISQSTKFQSEVSSSVHKSPLNTTSASPTKGSYHVSLTSQNSNQISENTSNKNLNATKKNEENKKQSLTRFNSKENATDVAGKGAFYDSIATNLVDSQSPDLQSNINKIANMSKVLTNEANSLKESLKSLSEDIVRTKQELSVVKEETVNFPYHLFLIEIIINKIYMKCDCFELDSNNLVIAATFLSKPPITLYDPSYGIIDDFNHINVGKSALFAMTYDKICSVQEFVIDLQISKQPPCSNCVTKVADSKIDYTQEFLELREELCKKWTEEQPKDNIMCTTSTPLAKNIFYLSCGDAHHSDSIGIIELTTRMSFLGKEITTAFNTRTKPKCTSVLTKEDNGMTMYSCHNVEMDRGGKILLDENSLNKKETPRDTRTQKMSARRTESPLSQYSSGRGSIRHFPNCYTNNHPDYGSKYDEIFTKMNSNELKIRIPKTTKLERISKYGKIQELCTCEDDSYKTGDQIQLELPPNLCYPDTSNKTYASNFKYTYKSGNNSCKGKERNLFNVTPSNCPIPVNMEKQLDHHKDVFILKIGKKLETKDKKTDLEIELVTPKCPTIMPVENNHISQQCSSSTIKVPKKRKKNKIKKKTKSKTSLGTKKGKTKSGAKKQLKNI